MARPVVRLTQRCQRGRPAQLRLERDVIPRRSDRRILPATVPLFFRLPLFCWHPLFAGEDQARS